MASDDNGDDIEDEIRQLRHEYVELTRRLEEFGDRLEAVEKQAVYSEGWDAEDTNDTDSETGGDTAQAASVTESSRGAEGERSEYVRFDEGFEINLGLKWLGRIGALAVTLGVAFFIVYAVQEELISHTARIVLGVVFGVALVAVGDRFVEREGYRLWSMITIGAGVAVAYFSVYASWGFEEYRAATGMTPAVSIALLTLVILGALALSVHRDAWIIGAEAFVLGYGTAFLVPEPGIVPLVYVSLLSVTSVGFAWRMDWEWTRLGVFGIFGSYGVFAWWADATGASPVYMAYLFVVGFGVVFTVYAFVCEQEHERWDEAKVAVINILNAAAFYSMFYLVTVEHFERFVGVATLGAGLAYLGLAFVARERGSTGMLSSGVVAWFLVLTSAWLQFDDGQITAAWAVVALVLVAVARSKPEKVTYLAAYATVVAVASKTLLIEHQLPTAGEGVTVTRPAAFLVTALVCYVGYAVLREIQTEDGVNPAVTAWLGTGVVTLLLGLELSGLSISVAWTVFALTLLVVGIAGRDRNPRLQGLALFCLTVAKVFVVDTAGLDTLGRTVSFIVLGVILLLASFIYSKYRDEIQDWV